MLTSSPFALNSAESNLPTQGRAVARRHATPAFLLRQRPRRTLKDRELPLTCGVVIAAEYVVKWADRECEMYTHIARLAALEYSVVAGSSMDNLDSGNAAPTPSICQAPPISDFRNVYKNSE